MTIDNIPQLSTQCLPPALISAQAALNLPEVQNMLKNLSEFQLGIFMPHTHEEKTGAFKLSGDDVVQVESGSKASFKTASKIASQQDSFLPVEWLWRSGQSAPEAVCEMVLKESAIDGERHADHNMKSKI